MHTEIKFYVDKKVSIHISMISKIDYVSGIIF